MQDNPLKPGYNFDAHLVTGLTPILEGGELDFVVDRPNGMKGFIINITSKGEGTVFSDEDQFDVERGDVLLFPPNTAHYYHKKQSCRSWFHRWIYFRPRAFWYDWLTWNEEKKGVFITSNLTRESIKQIEELFIDIDRTLNSDHPYKNDLALNQLEQLLIQCKAKQPDVSNDKLDPRVLDAINYMTQHLSEEFNIDDVSSHIYLSPSRLGHLFRDEMKMSINQWRDDQRVSRAKHLLLVTNQSINQISRSIGYRDPLYFSRVFKRKAGVSPKHFREQCI